MFLDRERRSEPKLKLSYVSAPDTPDVNGVHDDDPPKNVRKYMIKNQHLRECMAECLGVFIMNVIGIGATNQVLLSSGTYGTWMNLTICWGIAVMFGFQASAGVSGGHLNPAVTLAVIVYHGMPAWKLPGYAIGQTVGSFLGAAAIYALNYNHLMEIDPTQTSTRVIYGSYPTEGVSNITAFYSEVLSSALLMMCLFVIFDKTNYPSGMQGAPFALMLLIVAMGNSIGYNTGPSMNPARDFGARLFSSFAGWGSEVFSLNHYYFWIPLVAPCIGTLLGGLVYILFIAYHNPHA